MTLHLPRRYVCVRERNLSGPEEQRRCGGAQLLTSLMTPPSDKESPKQPTRGFMTCLGGQVFDRVGARNHHHRDLPSEVCSSEYFSVPPPIRNRVRRRRLGKDPWRPPVPPTGSPTPVPCSTIHLANARWGRHRRAAPRDPVVAAMSGESTYVLVCPTVSTVSTNEWAVARPRGGRGGFHGVHHGDFCGPQ